MAEMDYKYGCNKCGRFAEAHFKTGIMDVGKFSDNNLPDKIEKICICKNKQGPIK